MLINIAIVIGWALYSIGWWTVTVHVVPAVYWNRGRIEGVFLATMLVSSACYTLKWLLGYWQ